MEVHDFGHCSRQLILKICMRGIRKHPRSNNTLNSVDDSLFLMVNGSEAQRINAQIR